MSKSGKLKAMSKRTANSKDTEWEIIAPLLLGQKN